MFQLTLRSAVEQDCLRARSMIRTVSFVLFTHAWIWGVDAIMGAEAATAELDTTTTKAAPKSVAALRVVESGSFTWEASQERPGFRASGYGCVIGAR
jgi:hypothetical protein